MTHIEQMIQDLCPQGVEFKKLGEVTYWDKRFNEVERSMQPQIRKYHYYLASELEDLESPTGTIKILYTSNRIAYAEEETVAENVVDAEVVAIPWGGNANIKYFKGKFVTADNRIAVVRDTSILSTKFVYYWLKQNQEEIDSYYRGAGIKHPSMLKVLSFEIPIPPMEVQKRIVTVLDAYSALAAELQAELQMRRKQYEYYRTHLLTPHSESNSADKSDDCNWEWKTLGEICVSIKDGMHNLPESTLIETDFPIISAQNIYDNKIDYVAKRYVDEETFIRENKRTNVEVGDVLLTIVATIGRSAVVKENRPVLLQRSVCVLKPNKDICPEFLKFSLDTNRVQSYMIANAHGAAQAGLYLNQVEQIKIALPSLAEQRRIADLLGKFDKLITSMEDGIPAEQAAQQKRYEYYRDLLLTFPRKTV